MPKANTPIEIFRAGRHRAMDGKSYDFSASDLEAAAAAYDPSLHEAPLVVGHPKHDMPAYGWAKSLAFQDGKLTIEPDQVDPAFADLVSKGRFKKISAAFYGPDQIGNPKPGSWYLRHVGFLGAAAPAVKGLKNAEFGDDDSFVEFADTLPDMPWVLRSIARLFRGVRDSIIAEKGGVEAANQIVSDWDIQAIEDAATRCEKPANTYSEQLEDSTVKTEELIALETRAAEIVAREDKLKADTAAFAETQKVARRREDEQLLDQLVKDGKLSPTAKPGLLAFMALQDGGETIAFGEGDAAPKSTPREFFRDLLGKSGKLVNFAELSDPESTGEATERASDPVAFGEQLAEKAEDYIAEQAKKGRTISASEAVRHVSKEFEQK